jgi:phosphoglycolate phosphatase-like HAD superfamily hydrolase
MILVTSRDKFSSVEEELKWFNIRRFFTLIVTREVAARYHRVEVVPLLPFQEQRRELYECAMGLGELDPTDVVCMGDSVGELEPAKKLQMTTIGVLTGISGKDELRKAADFIVENIAQVVEILG